MRKITLLLNIVMISLLIMGIAYAEWSLGFALANTADTGYLDIDVIAGDMLLPRYTSGNIDDSVNYQIDVNINKIYPGAVIVYDFDIKNTGTMGVHLDDLVFQVINVTDNNLEDYFDISYAFGLAVENYDETSNQFKDKDQFIQEAVLSELKRDAFDTISVRVIFDPDNLLSEDQFENETLSFKLTINYSQFD